MKKDFFCVCEKTKKTSILFYLLLILMMIFVAQFSAFNTNSSALGKEF